MCWHEAGGQDPNRCSLWGPMALNLASVVRRNMKETGRFERDVAPPGWTPLEATEHVFGTYKNPEPWASASLCFTSAGIWPVDPTGSLLIRWVDLVGWETPEKERPQGVIVHTRAGGSVLLRCVGTSGPHGRYKDAFSLLMVVKTVVEVGRGGANL